MPETEVKKKAASTFKGESVTTQLLEKFGKGFRASSQNVLAMNAVCNNEMTIALKKRDVSLDAFHVFSDRLEEEAKVTNQKASGRCWLFAALNTLRLGLMKKYKLEEFEFSQAYLMWYDKLEKSNWFLENIIYTSDEDLEGRLVQFILKDPIQDGGQWDMAVNLIEKYGLVPKVAFPESAHSGNTGQMNWLLTCKLREFAKELRGMKQLGKDLPSIQERKQEMLAEIYKILSVSLGEPPKTFDWSFRDKDKKFQTFKGLTPLEFLKTHVPNNTLNSLVSLIHDPRHEYGKLYTVDFLGNVVGGRKVIYVNLPIEDLKKATIKSIKEGSAVWFGCDVGKFCSRKEGVMDIDLFDYKNAFGVEFKMNKADRLKYGESTMTHAMVINGVHLDGEKRGDNQAIRWRIENSWGDENGDKGFYSMTDAWFSEYVYQVVIDKERLTEDQRKVLDQEPIALPPWDPLGALA